MNRLTLCIILFVSIAEILCAQVPVQWLVQSNQAVLLLSPTMPETNYLVLARSNAIGAHWIHLTGAVGQTGTFTRVIIPLSQLPPKITKNPMAWTLAAGSGEDSDGDGLLDLYEELATRSDPFWPDTGDIGTPDTYRDPDGDNWIQEREFASGTDPLRWDQPPGPSGLSVKIFTNRTSVVAWEFHGDASPAYFEVERAERTLKQPTNAGPRRLGPRIGAQRQDPFTVGAYRVVARVLPEAGKNGLFRYSETNVDTFAQPSYRVRAQFNPFSRAIPTRVDTAGIQQTLRRVTAARNPDGFDVTVNQAQPRAMYLLLARNRRDDQWRASGYFQAGTNAAPVTLKTDVHGMMTAGQKPILMPSVKFAPELTDAEFVCGSGEDSDGDGLPDVYEALVTKTEPHLRDSGSTGIMDGFKDPDRDGWTNLEEFRRRSNPSLANSPPQSMELKQPTLQEFMQAIQPQSDLRYEPSVFLRDPASGRFVPLNIPIHVLFPQRQERSTSDLRVYWQRPGHAIFPPPA